DPRRLLMATGDPCDPAADVAAPDRCDPPHTRVGVAVPDCCGGDRVHRRVGLSHFPGPSLPGDGRDPALCRLDHCARVRDGLGAESVARQGFSLGCGLNRCSMPRVSVKGLWKSYGDTVVLENLNLEVAEREFVTIVGASGCGKTTFLR